MYSEKYDNYRIMKKPGILFLILLCSLHAAAQISTMPFSKVELRLDTMIFDSRKNLVILNKEPYLYFNYQTEQQDCEVRLYAGDLTG